LGKSIVFRLQKAKYPVSCETGFYAFDFIGSYNREMSAKPMPRIHALIPCGGTGSRSGESIPKQYRVIAGLPMVAHTLAAFAAVSRLARVGVVISSDDAQFEQVVCLPNALFFVAPCAGNTRAQTVFLGLIALLEQGAQPTDWVLVHDAARCLIRPEQIDAVIDACLHDEIGGLLALKLPDTLKQENAGRVSATVDRSDKWLAQTPQMFRIGALLQALEQAGNAVTDEASAMEAMGFAPKLIAGSAQNFKVTYPEDFALAEAVLLSRKIKA
jgi:2-C-methyl-D-erythritol 4-phosphate cytidylyltransferase